MAAAEPTPALVPTQVRFQGFPAGGFDFLLELQAHQSREWFKSSKERYQELWVRPLEALLEDMAARLVGDFPEVLAGRRHVFRIQRDTRFSADKSPYKTNVAAHIQVRPSLGAEWAVPGFYVHFGLENNFIGGGSWDVGKELLPRFRAAIADERQGGELAAIVSQLTPRGIELASHERLKRVPAPYPQDHPRAELLKLKGLSAGTQDVPEELMGQPAFVDWLFEQLHHISPLIHWLEAAVN
ncbi:MAG TPA: DUF2461 domain-containing protein [Chloroflexota bacterium]|nr:DUF2461 domain-containing protein [Chloroflexota bacterium]